MKKVPFRGVVSCEILFKLSACLGSEHYSLAQNCQQRSEGVPKNETGMRKPSLARDRRRYGAEMVGDLLWHVQALHRSAVCCNTTAISTLASILSAFTTAMLLLSAYFLVHVKTGLWYDVLAFDPPSPLLTSETNKSTHETVVNILLPEVIPPHRLFCVLYILLIRNTVAHIVMYRMNFSPRIFMSRRRGDVVALLDTFLSTALGRSECRELSRYVRIPFVGTMIGSQFLTFEGTSYLFTLEDNVLRCFETPGINYSVMMMIIMIVIILIK